MAVSFNMAQAFDISAGSTTASGQSLPAVVNPGKFHGRWRPDRHRLGVRMH
jgi:hypothetical protein